MFVCKALMVISLADFLRGQTLVDLRMQAKDVDFSAASTTKPFKTGSTLPAACGTGEAFFQLNAPLSANLYLCPSQNDWVLQGTGLVGPAGPMGPTGPIGPAGAVGPAGPAGANGAIGHLQTGGINLPVESILNFASGGCTDDPTNSRTDCSGAGSSVLNIAVNGTTQGAQPTLNFVSGTGIIQSCTNNTGANRVDCIPALDTGYAPSRSMDQAGIDHSALATSAGVGGVFSATASPPLTTYTQNQWFNFVPVDHDCVGNDTINLSGVGPEPLVVLSSGALVNVGASGCKMGIPYMIIAVGSPVSSFRLY
jgi:hypothetical protein